MGSQVALCQTDANNLGPSMVCSEKVASVAYSDSCHHCAHPAGAFGCQLLVPARMVPPQQGGEFDISTLHDEYESASPIDRSPFDFQAHRVVATGWRLVDDEVPGVFKFVGRDARVIVETGLPAGVASPPPRSRVLLALPNWAVDLRRTEWLQKVTQGVETPGFCQLAHVTKIVSANTVVCHFIYPNGIPLQVWTRRHGRMSDYLARLLCRSLLQTVAQLSTTPVRFWGLVMPSMIFLSEAGVLQSFVPLGAVLSWSGVQSTVLDIDSSRLAPEMQRGFEDGSQRHLGDRGRAAMTDSYAVAAVVLEAMAGVEPSKLRDVSGKLSENANDFLHRMLYKDVAWRLSVEDALDHPWLLEPLRSNRSRRSSQRSDQRSV